MGPLTLRLASELLDVGQDLKQSREADAAMALPSWLT